MRHLPIFPLLSRLGLFSCKGAYLAPGLVSSVSRTTFSKDVSRKDRFWNSPEGPLCGLSGIMHVRLLLTQHFLAVAADFMQRCSLHRGSGRSKLQYRWIPYRPFTATCSSSHIADLAVIHFSGFAGAASSRRCSRLCRCDVALFAEPVVRG
jgi:hypothetical protein